MKGSVVVAIVFIIVAVVCVGFFCCCYKTVTGAALSVYAKWKESRYHKALATHVARVQREREEQLERARVEDSLHIIYDMEEARGRHDEVEAGHQLRLFEEFGGITVTKEVTIEWHDLDGNLLPDPVDTPTPSIHEAERAPATSIHETV